MKIHFVSGLPRSGSTLLCNILNQNPRFQATATSGVLDLLLLVRNNWERIVEFKASPKEFAKLRVLRSILPAFYHDVERPVVFDKSRGWTAHLEMVEKLLGTKARVLVPVRDLRDILASFEKLWRRESQLSLIAQERDNPVPFQTVEGRCQVWLRGDQAVGKPYNAIKDALLRGYGDRLHFVFFDKLTTKPAETLADIYRFLGEEPFVHDFETVEQTTTEDDRFYGFTDLHKIRQKVAPMPSEWQKILGPEAEKYGKLNFWDTLAIIPRQ